MSVELIKRRWLNSTHRWLESQINEMLFTICEAVKHNIETFEKPTAQKFYTKILLQCPLLEDVPWQTLRGKMRYLKSSYIKACQWKNQTGAGLMERGEHKSVTDYVHTLSPQFDTLDSIFGQRISVNPPFIFSSTPECLQPNDNLENIEVSPVLNDEISFIEERGKENSFEADQNAELYAPLENITKPTVKSKRLKPNNSASSPLAALVSMQDKKIELESKKLQWTMERENKMLELKESELKQQVKLKEMEVERDLRLEKLRLENEKEIRKFKIELKYKRN